MSGNIGNNTNLFVDLEEDGTEIPDHASMGAWLNIKDDHGYLVIPAATGFGKNVLERDLHHTVSISPGTKLAHLSEVPDSKDATFARIKALLEN